MDGDSWYLLERLGGVTGPAIDGEVPPMDIEMATRTLPFANLRLRPVEVEVALAATELRVAAAQLEPCGLVVIEPHTRARYLPVRRARRVTSRALETRGQGPVRRASGSNLGSQASRPDRNDHRE